MEAAWHAALTIERRVALISDAAARGALLGEPEVWRMGPEKLAALASGMAGASLAAAAGLQRLAFEPARLTTAVLAAAVAPSRRKVRANARRLRRKRRAR